MIMEFVNRFDANRANLHAQFMLAYPSYEDIVRAVVAVVGDPDGYPIPDPNRITAIDHGDYQGTILYVVAGSGYQPSDFWYVRVSYGSCSHCDTLQGIRDNDTRDYDDHETPTTAQADSYLTLALHIVQGLTAMQETD